MSQIPIRIDKDVYQKLIKYKGIMEYKYGKNYSIPQVIRKLVEDAKEEDIPCTTK